MSTSSGGIYATAPDKIKEFADYKKQKASKFGKEETMKESPSTIDTRIVGGVPAEANAFPFFVTSMSNDQMCGASLIHPDFILTAAHCEHVFDMGVWVGASDRRNTNVGEQRRVIRRIPHPNYDDDTIANDIMLIQLDSPITSIQPIPWERSLSAPADRQILTTMGFGLTSEWGDVSMLLRQVDVPAVDDRTCSQYYNGQIQREVMFCAGEVGKDSCQGDSGGPIIDRSQATMKQVGIVSWGEGCARSQYPGVYTRIAPFSEWMTETICQFSNDPSASLCFDESGQELFPRDPLTEAIQARFIIRFDSWPSETRFDITEITPTGVEAIVFSGPDINPEPNQNWMMRFTIHSGRRYKFRMLDYAWDGFDGLFGVFAIVDGSHKLLLRGPTRRFSSVYEAEFVV